MTAFCHIYGQLGQTGDEISSELQHMFDLGLVCDTEMPVRDLARHRGILAQLQARGGLIAPTVYPPDLDPSITDSNWWKLSADECERLLLLVVDQFAKLGFGRLEAINTYTPGNTLVKACRRLGIRHILGFCAPIVIEDGGWEIAHYGSPLSPYFISDEDYRKPENPSGRPDPVLMASMELRNPLVCLDHWSEGPWCPLNSQAVDRWLEPSELPYPFLQIAEDWIRQSELDSEPRFFHINLQYFFAKRCFEHNRRALEWIARQRDQGRLKIVGLRDWAELLAEKGGFYPQTTLWSGEMPGHHTGHRPGFMPDVLVDENLSRQAIWQFPKSLPQRCYDYRPAWNYPPFQPDGTAPASQSTDGFEVRWRLAEEGVDFKKGELTISNSLGRKIPPIALWEILDGCSGPFSLDVPPTWSARVAPHPSGVGGVVILETDGISEESVFITIRFHSRSSERLSQTWGDVLEARTYYSEDRRPYTMIAAQTPEPFKVLAQRSGGPDAKERPVLVESLCGGHYQKREFGSGAIDLAFDGTRLACWHRIWDLTVNDFSISGVEQVEADLREKTSARLSQLGLDIALPSPGFQLFGNIRDTSRWDRQVARAAGEQELAAMDTWFHQQRPEVGETCIEVHAGIYLPRGSITKVLGHEFDVVKCAPGYSFRELCVDYPQGWDWGVSAWVQWRWLKFRLEGPHKKGGDYTLHIHAIDPESRDLCQRIHLIHPLDSTRPHLCVEPCWEIPKGVQSRWTPAALCSVKIPQECLAWPAIDIWLNPVERIKLDDWIAEQGAPGMLSHLWVTKG